MPRGKYGSFTFTFFFSILAGMTSALNITHDSLVIMTGESLVVTCTDDNNTRLTWTSARKGKLSETTEPRVETHSYGTSLYFTAVTQADKGDYVCKGAEEEKTFHLTVEDPMEFRDTSTLQEGKEGETVTLRCEVTGSSIPIISWHVGGKELKQPKYEVIGDGLLVTNLTKEDSKSYICRATQRNTGDVKQRLIKLRVLHKPYPLRTRVLAKVEPVWGYVGSRVNLTCDAIAEPPPQFKWNIGKSGIAHEGKIYTETYKSILQISIKNASVFGNYMCEAINKYGKLEIEFSLREGERPNLPDFVEFRGANADLLDLGIHPPKQSAKGMEPIGYDVQYRIDDGKRDNWKIENFNVSEDGSYPLRNLQHSTKYEVRVATRNVAGVSPYTNSSFFKTLALESDRATKSFVLLHSCLAILITAVLTCW